MKWSKRALRWLSRCGRKIVIRRKVIKRPVGMPMRHGIYDCPTRDIDD